MNCWHKFILLATCLLSSTLVTLSQESLIVDFHADLQSVDPAIGNGVTRLLGNVRLKHKDLFMTCDSAYINEITNEFFGYNRVHIIKADTVDLYGKKLYYNGQTELAKLEGNVLMSNGKVNLKAPRLDYDMKNESAMYYGGGQIIDSANTVESFWGYFFPNRNEFVFKENVILSNPDNTLFTDSLLYNSESEEMFFEGPTEIFSDTNYITCNWGHYNSKDKMSTFTRSVFMQAKQQYLRTDSLQYNQADSIVEAFKNIELKDTLENMIIRGEHLIYHETINRFQITEDVLFIMAESKDSLFLHADTLVSTREEETKSRRIQAFDHVQFFRTDIQGRCDSLDYLVADSLIQLFEEPLVWMDNNQITADTLGVYLGKKGIDRMEMRNRGFMVTWQDSTYFDQIKGKKLVGFFVSDKLNRVVVTGNGESRFYPKDGDQFIGQNRNISSNYRINFLNGKVDKISFIGEPDSKLIPMKDLKEADMYLEGFKWLDDKRPKNRDDIRVWK